MSSTLQTCLQGLLIVGWTCYVIAIFWRRRTKDLADKAAQPQGNMHVR